MKNYQKPELEYVALVTEAITTQTPGMEGSVTENPFKLSLD